MTITVWGTSFLSFGQIVYEQGIVQGGVTGAGFSSGMSFGSGDFNIFIEPNSTIKKVLLFTYSMQFPDSVEFIINNTPILVNSSMMQTQVSFNSPPHVVAHPVSLYVRDVTGLFDLNTGEIQVTIPDQSTNIGINEAFWTIYLFVVYENIDLNETSYTIVLNDLALTGKETYVVNNINPIQSTHNVGFAIYTDRHSSFYNDRSIVVFNESLLGEIYTPDNVNLQFNSSGVKGHFYYQNSVVIGLDDDIANNSMNESDGLAEVSSLIQYNSTSVSFSLQHGLFPNQLPGATNVNLAYFLTYTSPCQPFIAALLTSDTTTCAFVPVQLGASGGNTSGAFQAYEWLPQQNLSCYDCPNPIFTGNSTTNYTVRIRNTDSCSVVYPVRVRVLPNPSYESIEITESVCGGATGEILVTSAPLSVQNSFQINNGTPQNNGTFNNLASGEYTITLTNEHGCSVDSTVVVGEFNNVQAAFSVNPTTGTAPLDISITNQSQNATEYFWDFSNQDGAPIYQGSGSLSGVEAPLAGLYTLTLIAGNGTPHCNDTTSVLIVVKEPFVVFAYTHVTNEANLYQVFFSGVSEYDYKIYALDGKLVFQKNGSIESAGHVDLWEISKFASGMYVFRIKVKDLDGNEHDVEGKAVVVR